MNTKEETEFKNRKPSPEIMQLIYLDEIASRLDEFSVAKQESDTKLNRLESVMEKLVTQTNINTKQLSDLLNLNALSHAEEFAYPFPPEFQYQYKQVNAGATDTIWTMDLHSSTVRMHPNYVAVITLVANSWYEDTSLRWMIDTDKSVERVRTIDRTVEEALGSIEDPIELKPRYVVIDKCEWTATNNDVVAHVFWVYHRGFFVLKSLYNKLTNILLEEPDRPFPLTDK